MARGSDDLVERLQTSGIGELVDGQHRVIVLYGAANDSRAQNRRRRSLSISSEPQLRGLANANSIRAVGCNPGLAETITQPRQDFGCAARSGIWPTPSSRAS